MRVGAGKATVATEVFSDPLKAKTGGTPASPGIFQ